MLQRKQLFDFFSCLSVGIQSWADTWGLEKAVAQRGGSQCHTAWSVPSLRSWHQASEQCWTPEWFSLPPSGNRCLSSVEGRVELAHLCLWFISCPCLVRDTEEEIKELGDMLGTGRSEWRTTLKKCSKRFKCNTAGCCYNVLFNEKAGVLRHSSGEWRNFRRSVFSVRTQCCIWDSKNVPYLAY